MKKILFNFSIVLFITVSIFGQNDPNAPTFNHAGYTIPHANVVKQAIDGNGDIIIIGQLSDTTDFDPLSSAGEVSNIVGSYTNAYVVKYSSNGVFQWVHVIHSSDRTWLSDIAVDNQNNILIAGAFKNNVDLDLSSAQNNYSYSGTVALSVTLNSNGIVLGSPYVANNQFGMNNYSEFTQVEINDGIAYLYGIYDGGIEFWPSGSGIGFISNAFGTHLSKSFIYKREVITIAGSGYWIKQLPIDSYDFSLTPNSTLLFAGEAQFQFPSVIDLDPGIGTVNYSLQDQLQSALILEIDANGNYVSHRDIVSENYYLTEFIEINPNNGDILLAGTFDTPFDIDLSSATEMVSDPNGSIFLTCYNSNKDLKWYKTMTNSLGGFYELRDLHVDNEGDIYLGINTSDQFTFSDSINPFTITNPGSSIVKWNMDGHLIWGRTVQEFRIRDIETDEPSHSLSIVGDLEGVSDIDPTTNVFSVAPQSTFTTNQLNFSWNNCSIDTSVHVNYANGIFTSNETRPDASFQWFEFPSLNPVIGATYAQFVPTANGIYFLEISRGNCQAQSNNILIQNVELNENSSDLFQIYPNPTISNLTIESDQLISDFKIYSLTGQMHDLKFNQNLTKYAVDISKLSSGFYLLEFSINNKKHIQKIQKL